MATKSGPAKKKIQDSTSSKADRPKKRKQTYRELYTETFPFILPVKSDESRVTCTVCRSDFGIGHGGGNVSAHVEGPRHIKNQETLDKKKKELAENRSLTQFFATSSSQPSDHDMDVIRAETTMVDLVIDLNLPSTDDSSGQIKQT